MKKKNKQKIRNALKRFLMPKILSRQGSFRTGLRFFLLENQDAYFKCMQNATVAAKVNILA